MPNLAVTRKGDKKIIRLLNDCRICGNVGFGDPSGHTGMMTLKPGLYDLYWTDDDVSFTPKPKRKRDIDIPLPDDNDGDETIDYGVIGKKPRELREDVFDKTVDQLNISQDAFEIEDIDHAGVNDAVKKLKAISNYSYPQIDTFVDGNEINVVLKVYGKILLGLCKLMFRAIKMLSM